MTVELKNGTKASAKDIENLERFLDRKLPESYINFVSKFDGAVPEDNFVEAKGFDEDAIIIRSFVPVSKIQKLMIDIDYSFVQIIPIADDDCGNYLCLKLSDASIVFWDHEEPYGYEDKVIASDINDLLSQLKKFDISSIDVNEKAEVVWANSEFIELQRKLGNFKDE